jgi:hypothetical protein
LRREALVRAGQIEQAVQDGNFQLPIRSASVRVTDALASMDVPSAEDMETLDVEACATVKIPEGFAFYCLYPESYAAAAREWASTHEPASVLIVGLRSIGTTLSAVVRAALREKGFEASRITVRPKGDPYNRTVEFDPGLLESVDWLLVVDEGPGRSGSSMASVAKSAMACGFDASRIAFFPADDRAPGSEANAEVLAIWERIPRIVGDRTDITMLLAQESEILTGCPVVARHDFSGGKWREFLYKCEGEWPPAATAFERAKFMFELQNGRRILWKFAGFTSPPEKEPVLIQSRRESWSAPVLSSHLGFVATRWIDGTPLKKQDLNEELLRCFGSYLAVSVGDPLGSVAAKEAVERLTHMLYWNTAELLGEAAAQDLCGRLAREPDGSAPSYGDGRMAPHEWIQARDGRIVKTDMWGHDWDHTMVGPQSWLWDLAGLVAEWDLNRDQVSLLLKETDLTFEDSEFEFYLEAYRSFRRGLLAWA